MSEPTVQHDTIVIKRNFKASLTKVFAAWADPKAHGQWNVPGEDWEIADQENDFRIGGRQMSRFGPKGDPKYSSDGRYLDIVQDARIVSAGMMREGETRISATLCTVELLAEDSGTRLILTDQSAFLDNRETPADRRSGWGQILNRLEAQLGREGATV